MEPRWAHIYSATIDTCKTSNGLFVQISMQPELRTESYFQSN